MQHENSNHQASLSRSRDTGLALVLICLLLLLAFSRTWLLGVAIALLVAVMVRPQLFAPLAGPWFALSHAIGTVVSRILLTVIFFAVVTPVAIIRRLTGADPLQLKKWRQSSASVFSEKKQSFRASDLERPY